MKKLFLTAIAALTLAGGAAHANPYAHKSVATYGAECVFSFSLAYGSCYYAGLVAPNLVEQVIRGLYTGEIENRGWGPSTEYIRSLRGSQLYGLIKFNECHLENGGNCEAILDRNNVPHAPQMTFK